MMSQIVMSIFRSPEPSGLGEASSFFETLVPRVWMYLSSKLSRTNRRMSEVLPTAASPIKQTFTFIRLTSMDSRPATEHTRRDHLKRYWGVISADTRACWTVSERPAGGDCQTHMYRPWPTGCRCPNV